uniref:Uncharacterized protein n=1 Tax=Panagrolaimus sp. PS1159 TaxID=55785 RepID=A0AC35GWH2_9BILA
MFIQMNEKNFSVSAIAELQSTTGFLRILVTNVSFIGPIDPLDTAIGINYQDYDHKDVIFPMYANGINTTVENNSSFTLLAWIHGTPVSMFDGVIDEYSFSPAFAGLFSKEKPCFTSNFDALQNICCLSFFLIPETTNTSVPKCKQLKSQSIYYNASDNYSIVASSDMYYNISKTQITTNGSVTAPTHYGISYKINGNDDTFGNCNDLNFPNLICTYAIPDGDMKILLTVRFHNYNVGDPNFPDVPFNKTAKLGRIIFRGDLTLMEEGMPFTKKNNCFYNSDASAGIYVVYSQFCCQDFESY